MIIFILVVIALFCRSPLSLSHALSLCVSVSSSRTYPSFPRFQRAGIYAICFGAFCSLTVWHERETARQSAF